MWSLKIKLPLVGVHKGAGVLVARGELVSDIGLGDQVYTQPGDVGIH